MHNCIQVTENLIYLGGSERRLSLFESVYPVPRGVSYNSYLLLDEKTVLFDTVDRAVDDLFLENLGHALGGRTLDYLVIHHMEPDHSASLRRVIEKYPTVEVVSSQKTAQMIENFFPVSGKEICIVKEGDSLLLGKHTLTFISAPMVHWPEVMMSYLSEEGILFSADAFGSFGALGGSIFADEVHFERDFLDDARRYYCNIVGKYGAQVQNVLKKAQKLDIRMICPLHGPVWRSNIGWYLDKYNLWSSYTPEEKGVAVFYASIYGHMQNAAEILAKEIAKAGVYVKVYDVSATDRSELIAEAFRYSHLVFASVTYNGGIFVNMADFLSDLKAHDLRGRKYALVQSGSWAPWSGRLMQEEIGSWKNTEQIGEAVTVLSAVKEQDAEALGALAVEIVKDVKNS